VRLREHKVREREHCRIGKESTGGKVEGVLEERLREHSGEGWLSSTTGNFEEAQGKRERNHFSLGKGAVMQEVFRKGCRAFRRGGGSTGGEREEAL